MTDVTKQQVQALIKMGANEMTGGDVAAFLRLAQGEPDSALVLDRDKGPTVEELQDAAEVGGFLGNFFDLRIYEEVEPKKKLQPKQAWFLAWFGADERIRQPKTLVDVAKFLNISRQRLYAWQNSEWFDMTGIQRWERRFLVDHIPALYRKAYSNAMDDNGAVSNQAIRMLFEVRERHLTGTNPLTNPNLTQVNVYLPDNGR